jgi:hypothetical protein
MMSLLGAARSWDQLTAPRSPWVDAEVPLIRYQHIPGPPVTPVPPIGTEVLSYPAGKQRFVPLDIEPTGGPNILLISHRARPAPAIARSSPTSDGHGSMHHG